MPTLKSLGIPVLLANAFRYVGIQQTVAKYNLRMLYPMDFTLGTLIIIDLQIIPSSRVIWNLLSKGHCQDHKHILTIKRPKLQQQNRESTEGVLKVKSREKTRQVHENWSQQLEHKH